MAKVGLARVGHTRVGVRGGARTCRYVLYISLSCFCFNVFVFFLTFSLGRVEFGVGAPSQEDRIKEKRKLWVSKI